MISNIESLDKDVLGKYFGNPNEENQSLFRAFCKELKFSHLEIDSALRILLYYFSLPGESQQIDRIITIFSEEYCNQNPEKLCGNSVYLLAYSLIMLQTDAHNRNVENKMTLQTFSGMVKHIKVNEKTPLDSEYITQIYQSVTEFPISVHFKQKKKADM